jgi:hypothetical protein
MSADISQSFRVSSALYQIKKPAKTKTQKTAIMAAQQGVHPWKYLST